MRVALGISCAALAALCFISGAGILGSVLVPLGLGYAAWRLLQAPDPAGAAAEPARKLSVRHEAFSMVDQSASPRPRQTASPSRARAQPAERRPPADPHDDVLDALNDALDA